MANRPKGLYGSDGITNPDDYIPRCMDAAQAPRATFNKPDGPSLRSLWSPSFTARVQDAVLRLCKGEHPNEVRERHGAIVTRQAAAELLPHARMVP